MWQIKTIATSNTLKEIIEIKKSGEGWGLLLNEIDKDDKKQ